MPRAAVLRKASDSERARRLLNRAVMAAIKEVGGSTDNLEPLAKDPGLRDWIKKQVVTTQFFKNLGGESTRKCADFKWLPEHQKLEFDDPRLRHQPERLSLTLRDPTAIDRRFFTVLQSKKRWPLSKAISLLRGAAFLGGVDYPEFLSLLQNPSERFREALVGDGGPLILPLISGSLALGGSNLVNEMYQLSLVSPPKSWRLKFRVSQVEEDFILQPGYRIIVTAVR